MARIDISSLLNRYVDIQMSYCFTRHWSASGEAAISFKGRDSRISNIEREHKEEFSSSSPAQKSRRIHNESLLFHYWPKEAFRGISIAFGIQTGNQSIRPLAQLSYIFSVWKGFCISSTLRNESLRIGINYIF